MPTTPDRPDRPADARTDATAGPTRAADREPARAADRETKRAADRETVPVDVARRAAGLDDPDLIHETVPVDVANHETRRVDVAAAARERATVTIDPNRETVMVPGQRRPAERGRRAPLPVAAGVATLWAALVSFLPVAAVIGLARTLEGAGGLGGATRTGLAAWLLGHGVPLGTAIGPLAVAPLLLTLLAAWRLHRAGLHVTRAIGARRSGSARAALLVAAAVGLWYGALGALVAALVDGPGTTVSAARAFVQLALIGAAGALVGSLRSTDALLVLATRIPPPVRHGVRTGVVAALLILACGAAFTGLSLALGGGEAADMIAAYRTGVAGQAGITLVSLAYGGNAAVWAVAYLLGPGFALGADSTVRLTEVTVGPLPTLPLLSALPSGPMGATGALLLAVPVLAGMYAGWLLTQRLRGPEPVVPAWPLVLGSAAVAGPVAGILLGVLAGLSGGSVGDGRLSDLGPVPWQVALISAAVVAVSAGLGATAARAFGRPPRR